jgi:hypothetical protein
VGESLRVAGLEAALDRLLGGIGRLPRRRLRAAGDRRSDFRVAVPQTLRNGGARTVYWHMKLGALVGTTTAPADPATISAAAEKLFDAAATSSGCSTPLIALNELNGASTTTPWTTTNARYRQNVLDLLRALQSRGARPFLLVDPLPYTGGDAVDWWRQVAQVADIVPEVYFNAPAVMRQGVILGSRRMRVALRAAVAAYTAIGVPVSKLGFVLGFQSGPGAGGREGLRPSSTWFRYAKLYTLAAKRVAGEFGVATVWTWGWGTFSGSGADPDKEAAACVYLWTRDPALCDGPGRGRTGLWRLAHRGPDRAAAWHSVLAGRAAAASDRPVAHDRGHARPRRRLHRALRPLGRERARPDSRRSRHGGDPGDRRRVFAGSRAAYSGALARTSGFALAAAAPAALFRLPAGVASPFTTGLGSYTVTPLGGALSLGAVPYVNARAAIRTALVSFARIQGYEDGARKRAESALNRTICLRDDLPSSALVSVSTYLPFLALNA